MMPAWLAAALGLAEVILVTAACFVLLRRAGHGLAAAAGLAPVVALAVLSCLIQTAFLLGLPLLLWVAEAVLAGLAVHTLVRHRPILDEAGRRLWRFVRRHPTLSAVVALAWLYLSLQVLLLPPGNNDSLSYNLARVLLFQQDGTLLLERYTDANQAFQPVGHDILVHLFLRFHTDYGIAIFSLLEYLAIVGGVYALARKHVAEAAALTAALVVAGLPTIVYQATSTKNDLAVAAAAVAALLLARRLLERAAGSELALLLLVLAFGVSAKVTFLAFAGPFVAVFGVLLLRAHGPRAWATACSRRRAGLALALAASAVLSQGWLFVHNLLRHGGWLGPPEWTETFQNPDGLAGGLANLVRYLLQSAHFLRPIEPLVDRLLGIQPSRALEVVWERGLEPLWGTAGTTEWPFRILWLPHEDVSWFGPLGFLLVLPAILWGLAARGRSLDGRVAVAMGPDARRHDAGDAWPSSRSGNAADGPMPPATRRATRGFGPPAALLVVDDDTASTPPRALHANRKPLPRDHPDFYHGLLVRGPRMVRATSGILVVYALLISLQVAWMQWNGRFFALVAAGGGLPLALVLARRRPAVLRIVQIASIAILLYAAAFNRQKPLIRHFWESWPQQLTHESIWASSDWGRDRLYYAARRYGDRRVEEILARIPARAEVGLLTSRAPVYPFLLGRPDVTWRLGRPDRLGGPVEGFGDAGMVLCLESGCPVPPAGGAASVVWEARPGSRPGELAAVGAHAP